eukprot:TRINITY_DN6241_c0_g1_i1.p1 TRINITY_DN6241_c0_g1~~TRINITY_DN6241_c0_g1_i1.p1  ORF type:complete len:154 (+),score=38.39 TRINITY_DN6241_c0_g1_i1:85-546(+)
MALSTAAIIIIVVVVVVVVLSICSAVAKRYKSKGRAGFRFGGYTGNNRDRQHEHSGVASVTIVQQQVLPGPIVSHPDPNNPHNSAPINPHPGHYTTTPAPQPVAYDANSAPNSYPQPQPIPYNPNSYPQPQPIPYNPNAYPQSTPYTPPNAYP